VRDAQCIAVTASSRSEPLAVPIAIARLAIVIALAAMIKAIPADVVVTSAIAAGKIQ
jgi:hypothetical protein